MYNRPFFTSQYCNFLLAFSVVLTSERVVEMVFFTCNACGESLKKAQVENHVNICRKCQVLSCIDCGKDFW